MSADGLGERAFAEKSVNWRPFGKARRQIAGKPGSSFYFYGHFSPVMCGMSDR